MAKKTYPNRKSILSVAKAKLNTTKEYLKSNIKKGELPKDCMVLKALDMTIGIIDDVRKF